MPLTIIHRSIQQIAMRPTCMTRHETRYHIYLYYGLGNICLAPHSPNSSFPSNLPCPGVLPLNNFARVSDPRALFCGPLVVSLVTLSGK